MDLAAAAAAATADAVLAEAEAPAGDAATLPDDAVDAAGLPAAALLEADAEPPDEAGAPLALDEPPEAAPEVAVDGGVALLAGAAAG